MKKVFQAKMFLLVIIGALAITLAGCGGGGGKSLDNVLAPTPTEDGTSITPFQDEDPDELTANAAADIGSFDYDPITTFSGGTSIASSGATWLDMATCQSCHATTYTNYLGTNHNKAWDKKEATFQSYVSAGRTYCIQCHTVTAPFMDLDEDHIFDAADGEYGAFGLSPAAATSSTNLVFGGTLGSSSYTNVNNVPTEYQGIQCENCHGPAGLHNGDKTKIVTGYQAYSARTCDYCHGQNEEWEKSGHSTAKHASHGSSSCTPCHTGEGYVEYAEYINSNLEMDIMDWIASGNKTVNGGDAEGDGAHNVNCATCHDPHSSYNEFQLRRPAEELCVSCHDSRKKIRGAYSSRTGTNNQPHHNLQGRILNGKGIINTDGKMLWDSATYVCDDSDEHSAADLTTNSDCLDSYIETITTTIDPVMGDTSCVDCHMYTLTDRAAGIEWLGHTFKPRTEACETCHTSMDAASVIGVMQADYQRQYDKLAARLATALAGMDTDGNGEVTSADVTTGITAADVVTYQNAQWNLWYVDYDGSKGIHNKDATAAAFDYTDAMLTSLGY